ncbi:MAG: response regulator [Deltaproteobacteria bacterium]|nr:response regulator [Deltaproteobacteria bacterium]
MVTKVLIVDDSRTYREVVRAYLEMEGIDCVCAGGTDEGLALAIQEGPDLVITDMSMPGMSGLELCRQLKANFKTSNTPIIMITSSRGEDTARAAQEAGVDLLLWKPFPRELVMEAVNRFLPPRPADLATHYDA